MSADFDNTEWNRRIEDVPHPAERPLTIALWLLYPAAIVLWIARALGVL